MKKTLLASAILAGLVSASAQAANVYDADGVTVDVVGGVELNAIFADSYDNGTDIDGTLGHDNNGYVGLAGTSKITDTATAYASFVIETEEGTEDDFRTEFEVDDLIIGLDTAYGDFSFGDVDSALEQVADFTDIAAYHGGEQEVLEGEGDTGFAYKNTFGAFTVNAEFIASSEDDEDSIGLSAVYSSDFGLDIGLGFVSIDDEDEVAVALGYTTGNLYLGLGYADVDERDNSNDDYEVVEFAVQYQMTEALTLTGLYTKVELDGHDEVEYYVLDALYAVNNNLEVYAAYQYDDIDDSDDDSEFVIGMTYDF